MPSAHSDRLILGWDDLTQSCTLFGIRVQPFKNDIRTVRFLNLDQLMVFIIEKNMPWEVLFTNLALQFLPLVGRGIVIALANTFMENPSFLTLEMDTTGRPSALAGEQQLVVNRILVGAAVLGQTILTAQLRDVLRHALGAGVEKIGIFLDRICNLFDAQSVHTYLTFSHPVFNPPKFDDVAWGDRITTLVFAVNSFQGSHN